MAITIQMAIFENHSFFKALRSSQILRPH